MYSRCHCVIQNHVHAAGVDLGDGVLPFCQVAKVFVEQCQVERLSFGVSLGLTYFGDVKLWPTEYASAPHGWLMKGDPAMYTPCG